MIVILLRIALVVLVVWGLWKLYIALFSKGRSAQTRAQDDWDDVLDAIDELPETTDPQHLPKTQKELINTSSLQSGDLGSPAHIESVMLHEAEIALSLMRQGDEQERLAAYHEIRTYEKLCAIADSHISNATWKKIGDIRRQAWELIHPPESL